MNSENFRLLGKLVKLHGYEGEALLISENVFSKKDTKTEWVFILIDGLPVPFFISAFRSRSEDSAIIKIEDINSDTDMQPYVGMDLFIEERKSRRIQKQDGNNDVDGYVVIDKTLGTIGIAKTVLNFNKNFLLQVFKDKEEILIPVNENIIKDIDDKRRTISTELPEGFIDLLP